MAGQLVYAAPYQDASRDELLERLLRDREDRTADISQLQMDAMMLRIHGFNAGYHRGRRDGQRAGVLR